MACYHPLAGWETPLGNVLIGARPAGFTNRLLELPCGSCIGCQREKAKAWALRNLLELNQHNRASFTTLTYENGTLPATLQKRHLQLFLKRARKALGARRPLRFFASGEYGEKRGRPHYHAILYGTEDEGLIDKAWGLGQTRTDPVTPARIAYTAGYTVKKLGDRALAHTEVIDYNTGEIYTWQPPFIQMSRRPGIGAHARQWPQSWRSYAVMNGHRMPVPRYLHEAWKAQATEKEIETLAAEKAERAQARDTSIARIEAAEKIEEAYQYQDAARRKYR